ncbi:MAG: sigma 54-interacting transcriptional regulator [Planctomycetota bacterium]|nr:sigma 54-interacting transcriptional regulator [Planctomycetota bacterium]
MFEVEIEFQGQRARKVLGGGSRWRIGRQKGCEVHVADPHVSADHAELIQEGEVLRIARTNGSNPIMLDGEVVENAVLRAGARFSIGQSTFTLHQSATQPAPGGGDLSGTKLLDTVDVLSSAPQSRQAALALAAAEASGSPAEAAQQSALALLERVSKIVGEDANAEALAGGILRLACERLKADRGLIARVADGDRLEIFASEGFPPGTQVGELVSKTVLKKILEERKTALVNDTGSRESGLLNVRSIEANRIRALACAPVLDAQGRLSALLYIDSLERPGEFNAREGELLVWLGQFYRLLADNLELRRRLEAEVVTLKEKAQQGADLIAESPAMIKLLERAAKAAASDAHVLILGESGSGKEVVARFIHQHSPRAAKGFVARNCAAIPETLFESELFGHRKGAFTGATSDRKGAFLEADLGTIFLDEIGDLAYECQAKLLRAIQDKMVRPVGADREYAVDVRIVSATNKDLREGIRDKQFREDLFYRIGTVSLTVPPLRERVEDIGPLARHFCKTLSGGGRTLSPAAEEKLRGYDWPGNVRELRAVIEQAVIFAAGGEVQPDELNLATPETLALGAQSLVEAERRHILKVLRDCNGNKTECARQLGIARSTLVVKLKAYGVP